MKKSAEGSTLVITIVISALIGSVLCSFSGAHQRAQSGFDARVGLELGNSVLEAGIEEALTHLNDDKGNPSANS